MADMESTQSEDAPESAPSAPVDHSAELRGFQFVGASASDDREGLVKELAARSQRFAQSVDDSIVLSSDGVFRWLGDPVGRLVGGDEILKPRAVLLADELLEGEARDAVQTRLDLWLAAHLLKVLGPLLALAEPGDVSESVKDVGKKVAEALGVLDRERVRNQVKTLDQSSRAALRKLGLRFGANYIYVPALLKPGARTLCSQLWGLRRGVDAGAERVLAYAAAGRTSFAAETPLSPDVYRVAGFRLCGERVVRVDIVERLTDLIRAAIPDQMRPGSTPPGEMTGFVVTPQMTSLTGCAGEAFASILRSLGFENHKVKKAEYEAAHRRPEPAATEPLVPTEPGPTAGDGEVAAGAEASGDEAQVAEAQEAQAQVSEAQIPEAAAVEAREEPAVEASSESDPPSVAALEIPPSEPEAEPAVQEGFSAAADSQPEVGATSTGDVAAPHEASLDAEETEPAAVETGAEAAPAEDEWIEIWRPAPRQRRHAPPPRKHEPRVFHISNRAPAPRPAAEVSAGEPAAEAPREEGDGHRRTDERDARRPSGRRPDRQGDGKPRERHDGNRHEGGGRPPFKGPRRDDRPERAPRDTAPAPPRRDARPIDPDSPFAKLLALKPLLEKRDKNS